MLEGVLSVLCTPFHEDGELDIPSLERLIEHNLSWGVSGVVCFGLAGEIYKLTDPDRARVLDAVVAQVAGRVSVIAGTEHTSVEGAVQRTRWAEAAGADAVMVYPPTFIKPGPDGVLEYYEELSSASSLPIIVQDAPAWTGIDLPLELLSRIRERCPTLTHVKVEAPPTAPKLSQLANHDLRPIGGYGALHLGEELDAGIDATMPGCGMPGLYVDIMNAYARGDRDTAWTLYTDALPLLVFQMGGLDLFVAVQKLLLHRVGVLSSTRLRRPGAVLTSEQVEWLDQVLEHRDLARYVAPMPR